MKINCLINYQAAQSDGKEGRGQFDEQVHSQKAISK